MPVRCAIAAALILSLPAAAQAAKDELEQQLKDLVGNPPTKLLIEFEGLDQPQYKLAEATFEVDGSRLPAPDTTTLNADGRHLVFHGDVKPGKHVLIASVAITDVAGALFSYEAGYTFKLSKSIAFEQQPGLEIHIVVTPELNAAEKDPKKKFVLKSVTTPKMLAKLEDGTMPEPPKPNLAAAAEVDAGTVAEVSPAEKAKLAKQAAAEEARRKKEEAAAAKAAAAEEKKRQREDALAARKAAAEEKKRQREEALAQKRAAAEEKKRQKEEALAAKTAPPSSGKPPGEQVAVAPSPEAAPPAPEPVAEVVDAGPAVAVAEPPKPAPAPTAPEPTQGSGGGFGLPLPVIIGIAVAVLGLIIFVATRKKSPRQY